MIADIMKSEHCSYHAQHDQEIGTVARLAATSRIAAHRSAIKLDFSTSHDRNSVLILCIIVVAVFLARVVGSALPNNRAFGHGWFGIF